MAELSRRSNLSGMTIHPIAKGRGQSRPSDLTLAKRAAALGMPTPPLGRAVDDKTKQGPPLQ